MKTDFSLRECKILIDILHHSNEKESYPLSKLADFADISSMNRIFWKVINSLYEDNCLEIVEQYSRIKIVRVNKKNLRNLIDEQELINYFYDYFRRFHICEW